MNSVQDPSSKKVGTKKKSKSKSKSKKRRRACRRLPKRVLAPVSVPHGEVAVGGAVANLATAVPIEYEIEGFEAAPRRPLYLEDVIFLDEIAQYRNLLCRFYSKCLSAAVAADPNDHGTWMCAPDCPYRRVGVVPVVGVGAPLSLNVTFG